MTDGDLIMMLNELNALSDIDYASQAPMYFPNLVLNVRPSKLSPLPSTTPTSGPHARSNGSTRKSRKSRKNRTSRKHRRNTRRH